MFRLDNATRLEVPASGTWAGSEWWAHPAGNAIFTAANEFVEEADVITTKLVSGKVTFVHRRHWASLVAIGSARRPWQMSVLSVPARELLARVDRAGSLRVSGPVAKQLEMGLLVASEQAHTDSGAHALELTSWKAFAARAKLGRRVVREERARADLEAVVAAMNAECGGRATLPWQVTSSSRSKRNSRTDR